MTVKEIKDIIANIPDNWDAVVEQPEGDRYTTMGVRKDDATHELVIEL